jgi:CBS domain-containing protein
MRLPLLDAGGAAIGRLEDIVVTPGRPGTAPRVVGFVAISQRRRIFVNAGRVGTLDGDGARLRSWDVDLNPFKPKTGELLIGRDLLDKRIGDETVSDVALRPAGDGRQTWWEIAKVRLARGSMLRRRPSYRLLDGDEVPLLFAAQPGGEMAAEAARLRDMHPSDVAGIVRALQLRIIEGLDLDRMINVLEEMEYDDLADLLVEMPGEQRTRILAAMDEDDADVMRRLLSYEEGTAGSLLTPDIIIFGPTATVAEALAQIRDPEWLVSIAAQVFVVQPPYKPPTGTYLGVVHFQRLLRELPSTELGHCLETEPTITPDLPEREVAERLASYNMLAVGVCDPAGHLLGAITVDDVLDRTLPTGWRQRRRVAVPVGSPGGGGGSGGGGGGRSR